MKREIEILGVHGLVLRAADPGRMARLWQSLLGLPVLRRRSDEILLGAGPELFLSIRKLRRGEAEGLAEVHVAVKQLSATGKKGNPDPLGGDSWSRAVGNTRVTVRQFRRAPSAAWRKKRKPPPG